MGDDKQTYKFPKQLIIIYITVFVDYFGYSFIMPILPFYIEQLKGTAFELGIVLSIYAFTQGISCVVMGTLSDKLGRRLFLILSLFGSWSGPLIQSFSMNMLWFILARGYTGLLGGSSTIGQAYIADVVPLKYRPNYLSQIGGIVSIAFVVGPALGGLLGEVSYQLPFWVAAGCAFIIFITSFFCLVETNPIVIKKKSLNKEKRIILKKTGLTEEDSKRLEEIKTEFEVLKQDETKKNKKTNEKVHWNPIMIFSLLLRFCNDSSVMSFDSVFLLYIKDIYSSSSLNNSILICTGAVFCAIGPILVFPWLHDKLHLSVATICVICSIIMTSGFVMMAFVPYLWFAYISVSLMFICNGIIFPLPSVILSAQTPPCHQGNVLSIGVLATQAAFVIMPLVCTYVYEIDKLQGVLLGSYLSVFVVIFSVILFFIPGGRSCENQRIDETETNENNKIDDKDIESNINQESTKPSESIQENEQDSIHNEQSPVLSTDNNDITTTSIENSDTQIKVNADL